jgi:hypothetical protein
MMPQASIARTRSPLSYKLSTKNKSASLVPTPTPLPPLQLLQLLALPFLARLLLPALSLQEHNCLQTLRPLPQPQQPLPQPQLQPPAFPPSGSAPTITPTKRTVRSSCS